MFLIRLIYASTISDKFSSSDIEHILKAAREHNKRNHVTGMLCFNQQYFLQCLEGSRAKVNEAYQHILEDKRHTQVTLLDYTEIDMREFDNWSMGFMPECNLNAATNLKYSGSEQFTPYEMSGESAHQMMLALKEVSASID